MKKSSSLSHAKVHVFSDSVLCLGKTHQNPQSNTVWEDSSPHYRALDTIDGEPVEFEWNIFPGFTTLQLCSKVQEFMSKMSDPSEFRCSVTSHGDLRTMKKNANQVLSSFLSMRKDFQQYNGHSSDLDQKRNGILLMNTVHKENGTELQNR